MKKILSLLATGTMAAVLLSASPVAFGAEDTPGNSSTVSADASNDYLQMFLNWSVNNHQPNAAFDVRAFVNHPCYNAVGAEVDYCLRILGVQTDLTSMLDSSELNQRMLEWSLSMRCDGLHNQDQTRCLDENERALPQLLQMLNGENMNQDMDNNDMTGDDTDANDDRRNDETSPDENTFTNRHDRGHHLWELCRDHELSQARCYQTYLRYVTDMTVSTDDIEQVIR